MALDYLFQAYIEKEDSKKLKQKQRERMQPKMGKMDIDYQVSLYYKSSPKIFAISMFVVSICTLEGVFLYN